MEVRFDDNKYDRLETDRDYDAGFPKGVVSAYRKRLRFIRAARDVRDVTAMQSFALTVETSRSHQTYCIPLADEFSLEIHQRAQSAQNVFWVIRINSQNKK
jgi:proteic killer suppression protein